MNTNHIMQGLQAPFQVEQLSFRVGATTKNKENQKAIALAYIDARDAMKRLDDVVGPGNWQRRYPWSAGERLYCEVGIKIDGEWIWKGDGAGDTQVEAEKGAFSDAFKRACVNWGIAQYLYEAPNNWWPLNQYKQFEPATIDAIRKSMEIWQNQHFAAVVYAESVKRIKEGIAANTSESLSVAAEAWGELSYAAKRALWVAPSKGGVFTTEERRVLHSAEFSALYTPAKEMTNLLMAS